MTERKAPKTALVLAGGKGERLRPLTDDRPKPMVEAAGTPILVHHLRWLRDNGVERAVVLTGYLHEVVEAYFATPQVDGLTVECIAEERPLGRGGAFRNGFTQAGITDDLLVATNGDVITDQPLAEMLELHQRANALATLLLVQMVSPYGVVDVDDAGVVKSFVEKPTLPLWINGGVYLVDATVFARFPEVGDHETSTFPTLAEEGRIAALKSTAYWTSVESVKDLREVVEKLAAAAGA
jgi:NDP-sugar pyrophosphorylase family protein